MNFKPLKYAAITVLLFSTTVFAFGKGGCGEGKCSDCHSLSKEQAADVLSTLKVPFQVDSVSLSQVPGLWDVVVKNSDGLRIPVFLDFSLKYMIQGEAIMLGTMENITRSRLIDLNRVDYSTIPLEDALVVGAANAKHKIVVFDDPMCYYCQKLQAEMKVVVKKRPDIAFFIKMLPNEQLHATSTERARTILCEKSLELLEKSLSGQEIGKPKCTTDIVEKNLALAESLRIKPTPTLVYPDGRVMPGYRTADDIIKALAEGSTLKPTKK